LEHTFVFRDIAMVFAGAFVCGLLAWKLRQPILLGYVLAGLGLSPLTPGPQVHDVHNFEIMAEIGVILLMFSVGIEFSIPELMKVKWVSLVGAPLGILLCIGLGLGVGGLLGWPVIQGVAIGCIISVASTMVLLRLVMDRGEMATEHARLMVTMSLVEDLAVVILTVVLPSFSPSGGTSMRDAALTEEVGLSLALGAFLAGLCLGNSHFTHKLALQTQPLRDVFVAIFFVSVGMLLDPRTWKDSWPLIVLIVGLVLVGKFGVWFGVVRLFRYSTATAFRVGVGLTQIGEFSFILAQVSRKSGLISPELYHATLAASFVTILVNATLFRFVKPVHGAHVVAGEPAQATA